MDNSIMVFISGILTITVLDLVLCGDNIGVIALATRNLPVEYAKKANFIGVIAAVVLRILFACIITYIMQVQWLPIKLVGGLLLLKITWDFIKPHQEDESVEEGGHINVSSKFWSAVWCIIIADITMSLDNVLAIAGAAKGNIGLIVFGLIINIPIIFFGSQIVADMMKKHAIVIYIGGAILAHTALAMIFEDQIVVPYIPHIIAFAVPFLLAAATIAYGIYTIKNLPEASTAQVDAE